MSKLPKSTDLTTAITHTKNTVLIKTMIMMMIQAVNTLFILFILAFLECQLYFSFGKPCSDVAKKSSFSLKITGGKRSLMAHSVLIYIDKRIQSTMRATLIEGLQL